MKTLILSSAMAVIMTSGAFATSLGQVGSALISSDVITTDGRSVGTVIGTKGNRTITVKINGEVQDLDLGSFTFSENSQSDLLNRYTVVLAK